MSVAVDSEEVPSTDTPPPARSVPMIAEGSRGDIFAVYRFVNPRMFRSDFFEIFSKVHPVAPAILFIPVATYMLARAIQNGNVGLLPLLLLGGFFFWTLCEYLIHRFYFHIPPTNAVFRWMYYWSHGIHHQYPDDYYRLVMPPIISVPLALLFFGLFSWVLPPSTVHGAFAGFLGGYLYYDYVHFATHHVKPPRAAWLSTIAELMKRQRKLHMKHHFGDHTKGYNISIEFWDLVFETHDEIPSRSDTTAQPPA